MSRPPFPTADVDRPLAPERHVVADGRRVPTAEEARRLRDLTGFGLADCRRALLAADDFEGDVIVALAAIDANGLAIHVKGDRAAWVRRRAPAIAERWRAASPALDEAFPKSAGRPDPAPSP